ncbi:flippase [Bacillus cereus]|uniref:flippase n=1 Tax=Bacillus cereus TaxID=1396 RepID=UPI000B1F1C50|nr:flippase [Bacillus cereus]
MGKLKMCLEIGSAFFKKGATTKIFKNSSWQVSEKIFSMLIGVFVTAIVARYFGPDKFGQFNYALSFTALFTAISTLGLETLTVKSIVDKRYDEGVILCTSLYLRIFGGISLTILSYLIINIIEPNDKNLHMMVLIMSLTMSFKSLEVIEYWIQAHQKAKISSIIRMSAYIILAGLKVLVVLLNGNLIHYTLIYMLDAVIIGTALFIAYFRKRENSAKWKFNKNYAKEILSQSWYLILSGLMVTLYMRIDQVMLGGMMPNKTEVGVYSAAVQIASMWYFVPMAVITSFQPVIMSKKNVDEEGYLKSIQLLYNIIVWMGIGFGLLFLMFSNILVNILFGPEYSKAASILSINIWAGTFAMCGTARGIWLICEGLQKYSMLYIGAGAVVNIILNYILIPLIGGFGAAIATLISQITVSLIAPFFLKKTRLSAVMLFKAFRLEGIIKKR